MYEECENSLYCYNSPAPITQCVHQQVQGKCVDSGHVGSSGVERDFLKGVLCRSVCLCVSISLYVCVSVSFADQRQMSTAHSVGNSFRGPTPVLCLAVVAENARVTSSHMADINIFAIRLTDLHKVTNIKSIWIKGGFNKEFVEQQQG